MIAKKDLRIGNAVFSEKYNRIFWITEILDNVIKQHDSDYTTYLKYEELQGIPLTPLILEKCGFKNDHSTFEYADGSNNGELFITWIENEYVVELGNGNKNIPVILKYLHQLQNLYHVLTGQELNYTP